MTPTADVKPQPTSDPLFEALEQLDQSWDAHRPGLHSARHRDGYTGPARVAIILGFAEHVHWVAKSIVLLHRNDMAFESTALVREVYECAVTAMWVAHNPAAPDALAAEYNRGRVNLRNTLRKSATPMFRANADGIQVAFAPDTSVSEADRARNFERLCFDFAPESNDLYLLYRALSDPSHASFAALDHYISEDENGDAIRLERIPSQGLDPQFLLWLTASAVLWSAMAVNFLEPREPRRSELRKIAREIDAQPVLSLNPKAVMRIEKLVREAKRERKNSGKSRSQT